MSVLSPMTATRTSAGQTRDSRLEFRKRIDDVADVRHQREQLRVGLEHLDGGADRAAPHVEIAPFQALLERGGAQIVVGEADDPVANDRRRRVFGRTAGAVSAAHPLLFPYPLFHARRSLSPGDGLAAATRRFAAGAPRGPPRRRSSGPRIPCFLSPSEYDDGRDLAGACVLASDLLRHVAAENGAGVDLPS